MMIQTEGLSSLSPYVPHAIIALVSLVVGLFGKQGWAAFSRVILVERQKVPADNALTLAQAGVANREGDVKFVEAIEHAAVAITSRYTKALDDIDKLDEKYRKQTALVFEQSDRIRDLERSDGECKRRLTEAFARIGQLEAGQ